MGFAMTKLVAQADAFGLQAFADILPKRDPITGEDPQSFEGFHSGMMSSLDPITPYEVVIAENLITIEWDHLQHRRMRDSGIRDIIRTSIVDAVSAKAKDAHFKAGLADETFVQPNFNPGPSEAEGNALADRAMSHDPKEMEAAYATIRDLGRDPIALMSEAYRTYESSVTRHDDRLPDLEKRRRDVRRDYDLLQKALHLDGLEF
jgi:hypothetical protein